MRHHLLSWILLAETSIQETFGWHVARICLGFGRVAKGTWSWGRHEDTRDKLVSMEYALTNAAVSSAPLTKLTSDNQLIVFLNFLNVKTVIIIVVCPGLQARAGLTKGGLNSLEHPQMGGYMHRMWYLILNIRLSLHLTPNCPPILTKANSHPHKHTRASW